MAFNVDEKYILAAEREINIRFPDSFRQKMMLENGGDVLVPCHSEDPQEKITFFLYPFFDSSDKKRIKRTSHHILYETKNCHHHYGLEENLIVIGDDQSEYWLVFEIKMDGLLDNAVYLRSFGDKRIYKVAEDFADLIGT